MKTLLKLGFLLLAGVLTYNYFFGDEAEKETSRKVVSEIKDVGVAIKNFVKDEHQRIKEGKYKKVLAKVDDALTGIEAKVKNMDKETLAEYKKLKRESKDLESELDSIEKDEKGNIDKDKKRSIESKLKDLLEKTNDFLSKNGGDSE